MSTGNTQRFYRMTNDLCTKNSSHNRSKTVIRVLHVLQPRSLPTSYIALGLLGQYTATPQRSTYIADYFHGASILL